MCERSKFFTQHSLFPFLLSFVRSSPPPHLNDFFSLMPCLLDTRFTLNFRRNFDVYLIQVPRNAINVWMEKFGYPMTIIERNALFCVEKVPCVARIGPLAILCVATTTTICLNFCLESILWMFNKDQAKRKAGHWFIQKLTRTCNRHDFIV